MVAQVDEEEPAMVAHAVHQPDRRTVLPASALRSAPQVALR